jgi:hypothetical protein
VAACERDWKLEALDCCTFCESIATAMSTTAAAATATTSGDVEEGGGGSFLEAAANTSNSNGDATSTIAEESPAATTTPSDIENQRPTLLAASNPSVGILASTKKKSNTNNNINDDDDDDDGSSTDDSVFSFDSYELKRRNIPLKFQSVTTSTTNNNHTSSSTSYAVPFPSVNTATLDGAITNDIVVDTNVCPCRCLFFTLKESICLVLSALGCAVFLAGLIVLCMYLEGSLFEN